MVNWNTWDRDDAAEEVATLKRKEES